ncbi:hypothetical protein M422DRAFT_775923 [Sphaerobolus stellatus SS14]|nr:hypothetical protein M422DRAFT_775923 [Sphaerobolus stellatus SS14]
MTLVSDEEWQALSPAQIIQLNGQRTPNQPLFIYPSSDVQEPLRLITWKGFTLAIKTVEAFFGPHVRGRMTPPVVGILGNLDTITYHAIIWGIISTGGIPFLISPRNSPTAVSFLLHKTSVEILIVSNDFAIRQLSASIQSNKDFKNLQILPAPVFEDLYCHQGTAVSTSLPVVHRDLERPILILHSSGTTAFPKPIFLSARAISNWLLNLEMPGTDLSKHRFAVHALPPFHGMGLLMVLWAARTGMSLSVFPPRVPPIAPISENTLEAAAACESTIIITVPSFVELWSQTPTGIRHMKALKAVIFGGGPLNKKIGDNLSGMGIRLISFYGMTEIGPVCPMPIPEFGDLDWDWHTFNPRCDVRFIPQEDDLDIFELIFVESPTHTLAVSNTDIEGKRALTTNDLVIRHPTDPCKYRIYGRKDDQIMLSTGEKTNPGPLETIIMRDPLVKYAVMFGRGRAQNGILLQPLEGQEFNPKDLEALARYRNAIWPSIERANEYAPSHSRIFKEMILVTDPGKPMELTAKLTPRRHFVIDSYQDVIDSAYAAVEETTQFLSLESLDWSEENIIDITRRIVHGIMNKDFTVKDHEDIFEHGADSLHATYIRNSIVGVIKAKNRKLTSLISQNFVYSHPTISSLARTLVRLTLQEAIDTTAHRNEHMSKMLKLVEDFSRDFSVHTPSGTAKDSSRETVLVTGTTGALGTQLLAYLAASPEVDHIYALNRSDYGGKTLKERQKEALLRRGLDSALVDSKKITFMGCDFAKYNLGLESEEYSKLRDNISLIIHNAWKVNFTMSLDTFVPILKGLKTLVDLSLQSPRKTPPRFIYTGSVGVFRNWDSLQCPLEVPITNPQVPSGSGYTESKWIGERILDNAAERTPLEPIIVRIGQLTSNASGAWNSSDWLPAIVRSGQILGGLPSRTDKIAWISLEVAVAAIFEFRSTPYRYLHLTHPNPVPWMKVFSRFAEALKIPLIPWNEWLGRLRKDDCGFQKNPAVHLLDFYERASPVALINREAPGIPMLDLTKALECSRTLRTNINMEISEGEAMKWIKYWKEIGFLAN